MIDIWRSFRLEQSLKPTPPCMSHTKENECSKGLVACPYEDPTNLHITYQPIR